MADDDLTAAAAAELTGGGEAEGIDKLHQDDKALTLFLEIVS